MDGAYLVNHMSNSIISNQIRRDNLRVVDKVVVSVDCHGEAGACLRDDRAAVR